MGLNTSIEWTNHTANVWWGCTHHGTGCANCYAEQLSRRIGLDLWGPDKHRRYMTKWRHILESANRIAARTGQRQMVFINDMSDLFEDPAKHTGPISEGSAGHIIPGLSLDNLVAYAFDEFAKYPNLIFQFLTKRPEAVADVIRDHIGGNEARAETFRHNLWVGCSVTGYSERTIQDLQCLAPAKEHVAKLFLSYEPALKSLELGRLADVIPDQLEAIDWIIVGGESGPGSREFHLDWMWDVLRFRELWQDAGHCLAVFNKQIGSRPVGLDPNAASHCTGKRSSKGNDMELWPDTYRGRNLRVREYPISELEFLIGSNA